MYNCFDIATYFLRLAEKEGGSIKTMKLLKLTYIAHGYHLGFFDCPLFNDMVEAWRYGPVIPNLYKKIKKFGKFNVLLEYLDLFAGSELSDKDKEFLSLIWKNYKGYSGFELSALTHQDNTPWHIVYSEGNGVNMQIPNRTIEAYYKDLISGRHTTVHF